MNPILENYLFDAFANASDNIYVYVTDCKLDLTRWSKRCVDFFGMESEYVTDCKTKWLDRIHPDDRAIYIADISAVFNGTSAHHNCQYRVRSRYGEYVWVECRGSLTLDNEGAPAVFAGIMTRIDNQTKYDNLTHLPSGFALMRRAVENCGAIMLVGIEGFRTINSQHGIRYGNKVLIYLADVLTKEAKGEEVYKFQGDEFVVIAPGKSAEDMAALFRRVSMICAKTDSEVGLAPFTISAGIVEVAPNELISQVVEHAELSYEFAKKHATHMAIYSADLEKKRTRKNLVSEELLKCIKNDFEGFRLVFQPILANTGDRVVACESLLRWKTDNEQIGACYPDEFISILEENGGISDVGYFVMRQAIRHAAGWQKRYQHFNVTFNVSYLQLQDPDFVPAILEAIKEYDADPTGITVELTESVLEVDTVMIKKSFALLKEQGIMIALDDFGTGNSSFWMLHNIDVDIVKLDQSFIRGLDTSGEGIDNAIVESVGLMCDRIGCRTVAEGVETEAIWKLISKYEFAGLQGYLFSKPIEEDEFEAFLEKYNMK